MSCRTITVPLGLPVEYHGSSLEHGSGACGTLGYPFSVRAIRCILSGTLFVALLWLLFILHLAWLTRSAARWEPPLPHPAPPLNWCVVVPARNAAASLPETLESLRPACTVVVADNCDDDTAAVAARHGAEVLMREDRSRPGKGAALAWGLPLLLADARHFDAFAFIDADTVAAPGFLAHMDAALSQGWDGVQAYNQVLDPASHPRRALMYCALALAHYVRPLGQMALGGSTAVRGNGFALTRRTLERLPWASCHPTEDIELSLRLAQTGLKVGFWPAARVAFSNPVEEGAAARQRLRWEGGRMRLKRLALATLGQGLWRRQAWVAEQAIEVLRPTLTELLLIGVMGLAYAIGSGNPLLGATFATGLVALAWYLTAGLKLAGVPDNVRAALRHAPGYVLWKLSLYPRLWLKGGRWDAD